MQEVGLNITLPQLHLIVEAEILRRKMAEALLTDDKVNGQYYREEIETLLRDAPPNVSAHCSALEAFRKNLRQG